MTESHRITEFVEFLNANHARILGYTRGLIPRGAKYDIEDILQDVILRLIRSDRSLSSISHPLSFVYAIIRNVVISRGRKRDDTLTGSEAVAVALLQAVFDDLSEASRLEHQEIITHLMSCIDTLSETQREYITLRYLQELPNQEVAAIRRVTQPAATLGTRTAVRNLRECLSSIFGDDPLCLR